MMLLHHSLLVGSTRRLWGLQKLIHRLVRRLVRRQKGRLVDGCFSDILFFSKKCLFFAHHFDFLSANLIDLLPELRLKLFYFVVGATGQSIEFLHECVILLSDGLKLPTKLFLNVAMREYFLL